MLVSFSLVGLLLAIVQLALVMVPRSAKKLYEELLRTVMGAPLALFTKTDTGAITNRLV
jgi:ABC-type bacteriocin/lantibiotic exporter with double-glycine peptidase domain